MPENSSFREMIGALQYEQRARWQMGERVLVEELLRDHSALKADAEGLLELVYDEVLLREQRGEVPRLKDYLERFPHLSSLLRDQFEVHQALESSGLLAATADVVTCSRERVDEDNRDQAQQALPPSAASAVFRKSSSTLPVALPAPDEAWPVVPGYELVGELGRGGMGIVYRAWHERLKRIVALKVIRPGAATDRRSLARFRIEAEAAARLHHQNIVQIYEVGEAGGYPYCALEYVEDGNLADRIAGIPQPTDATARLVETLARAVQKAHDSGIVHRDLKPGNILLQIRSEVRRSNSESRDRQTTSGVGSRLADFEPKIADFGLAKLAGGEVAGQTESGAILGTPSYMSPEQAAGHAKDVGPAADVYALGAILYEMVTGRPPFRGATPMDTLVQVISGDPVPPKRLQPKLPTDLETICLKCLEKEPSRRYASAMALAEELGRFLAGKPIQARPLSVPARLWRWCHRNPALAALAGLAAAALITVVVLSISFGISQSRASAKLRTALDDADQNRRDAQRLSASLALSRGVDLCERGDTARGMLWLARSLEIAAAASAEDLERVSRANLAAWRRQLFPLRARLRHGTAVHTAAFSPKGDILLTGDADNKVRFWNADTGTAIGDPIEVRGGSDDGIAAAVFSPNGRTILTGGYMSGSVYFWDVQTRRQIGPVLEQKGGLTALALSPDGKLILTGGFNRTARLWDADTHEPLGAPLAPGKGYVMAVAFHPDGKTFVTGCGDGTVMFWDTGTRTPTKVALTQRGEIRALAFSPDGKMLLTGSMDGFARLWETATGKLLREVEAVRARPFGVSSVAFSPDGKTFLTGDFELAARLWDTASGTPMGTVRHRDDIRVVTFSPDGRTVLTAGDDTTACLWQVPFGNLAGTVLQHPSGVHSVAFSRDGGLLATGCNDKLARLWEASTGRLIRALAGHGGEIDGIAFSPDGRTVVTASYDKTARLWDVQTGKELGQPWQEPGALFGAAFSPDGRSFLIGGQKSAQQIWTTAADKRGQRLHHEQFVRAVAISPSGDLMATASGDFTAKIWDADSGALRQRLQHSAVVTAVAFSPNGRAVLTGSADHLARFWDVDTGKRIGQPLVHGKWVSGVAIGPDGRLVATAGGYTARFWDAPTGRPIGPALQHQSFLQGIALSPDGRTLLTGSDDTTARLWLVPVVFPGSVEQVVAWVKSATGLELDAAGVVHEQAAR